MLAGSLGAFRARPRPSQVDAQVLGQRVGQRPEYHTTGNGIAYVAPALGLAGAGQSPQHQDPITITTTTTTTTTWQQGRQKQLQQQQQHWWCVWLGGQAQASQFKSADAIHSYPRAAVKIRTGICGTLEADADADVW